MTDTEEEEEGPVGVMAWLADLVRTWGPAILAVLFIRTFIFEPFRIPSGSMVPTLLIGDHVLVTKYSYGIWLPFLHTELLDLGDPEKGDIIVFRYPEDPSVNYIKRVVATPGDTIEVRRNRITINGEEQPVEEAGRYDFIDDSCRASQTRRYIEDLDGVKHEILMNLGFGGALANADKITVPEDSVFVMGDNRDNSRDSRSWGFVRYDQVKGKAHFVWVSWNSCSGGQVGALRSERFFHWLYGDEA